MIAPQFETINANGEFDLQSFKANGPECSDNVFISTLDRLGIKTATYLWINYGGETGEEEMWVDADTYEAPEEKVTFPAGISLWIEGVDASQSIQSAGQVSVKDAKVQLCNGATMVGNGTPVKLALQDILCEGLECSDNVFISTLDRLGIKTATYLWINYGGESGEEEMWVDADTYEAPEEAVLFNPGVGLWVEGTSEEQYVTIPSVEL